MSWIEIHLDIPQQKLEDISAFLFAMGCEGIHLDEHDVIVYFSTNQWSVEIQTGLVEFISQFIPGFSRQHMRIKSVSDFDWVNNWKQHFKPLRITSNIVVLPPWEKYPAREGDLRIVINPQMAFGTGQHDSTQLMIITLAKILKAGMQVLDVGTGSGILAIIADKLGAVSVMAIDYDVQAIRNAMENAVQNSVSRGVHIVLATLEQLIPQEFDLVLANINRNVLLNYAGLFPDYVKVGGKVVLSGILAMDDLMVEDAYRKQGFRLVSKHLKKEWLALVFELKTKSKKDEKSRYRSGN
jgi:ribosomal protein L11 methyltransferase